MALAPRTRIVLFLVLTYALSSFFYVHIISVGKLRMLPVLGLMWCPGTAAILLRLFTQRDLRGTGWGLGHIRWQGLSYVLPLVTALVVYGVVWVAGIGGVSTSEMLKQANGMLSLPTLLIVLATFGLVQGAFFALGEEIGWRGFLVPELAKVGNFNTITLVSGIAWSVYHYPLILFANYNAGTPKWFAMIAFTWMVMASATIYAWMRLKSGSVWTGVILHASHNLFVQSVFDPLTADRGITKYVTTEFGVGLAMAYTVIAIYFWRRRAEVESGSGHTMASAVASTQV